MRRCRNEPKGSNNLCNTPIVLDDDKNNLNLEINMCRNILKMEVEVLKGDIKALGEKYDVESMAVEVME